MAQDEARDEAVDSEPVRERRTGGGRLPGWYEMRDENNEVILRVVFDEDEDTVFVQTHRGGLSVHPIATNAVSIKADKEMP